MANVDKSLEPVDINELADGLDDLEIEIIPDEVETEISMSVEVTTGFDDNLAESLPEGVITSIASDLAEDIENDKRSRKDWESAYIDGLKLLGLKYEERTEPWSGASGVFHPMITEAVVRFQSETITESFPAQGPVRTKIIGEETPDKKEAASRVENDMNYELTEVMQEFRPEHERMLWSLPATGSAFKKVYYDPSLGRQASVFVPAEDIILPYGVSDMNTCHRVTHEMRKTENEIIKLQRAGFYREITLPDPQKNKDDIKQAKDEETGFSDINDDHYTLYESHVDLIIPGHEDLDDDGEDTGIALNYVVTMIKGSNDVLAIRRNWKEDDELRLKRQHFVHYQYIPGFGAYGFGLFHLIGGFAKSATSLMRQLIDAGTLSNLPGGLKARGMRIKGDDTPIAPGEWRDVDIGSGAIRDNILPLPYKEPSQVLYTLLQQIVEEGRRFAATADLQVSDMSAQAPVGSTLAILERQLKVMTAIQARIHYSFKQELKLLAGIIRDYTDPDYDYTPEDSDRSAKKSDYDCVDIIPVSDPNAATMSQRVVQYQAVIQMAQMAPDIYDLPQLHRRMLDVLGIKNAEKLVKLPEDQKPKDPVTENTAALKGEPIKAFFYQDHQSHIAVHTAMKTDPVIMQLIGQNPRAPAIMAAIDAHIAEHAGYQYRQQIEQKLGMPIPPEDAELPPNVEMALSGLMAQAANQLLAQNQAMAAQQQAQQQAQDPMIQLQQQELALKQQELQIKGGDTQAKNALAAQRLQLEAQKVAMHQEMAQKKLGVQVSLHQQDNQIKLQQIGGQMQLEGTKLGAQITKDRTEQQFQHQHAGLKLGAEIAKNKEDRDFEAHQKILGMNQAPEGQE